MPTREEFSEYGKRSAKVRRERAEARKKDPLMFVREALPRALQDLVEASQGKGPWKDLSPAARLQALLKVIEYGVGKSIGMDKVGPKDPAAEGGESESPGTLEFQ